MSLLSPINERIAERTYRDAFQRLRVCNPDTIFDSKLVVSDQQTLLWDDQQTSGGSTSSAHVSADACFRMSVGNLVAGTRVRQTFRRFNYQPGKSQLVLMTFNLNGAFNGITKRAGLFDAVNGLFFQTSGTTPGFCIRKQGSDRVFTQSVWNADKLDGSGPSRLTLDTSKAQILYIDYEWLGTGTVRFGFFLNGKAVVCHTVDHANIASAVYMTVPSLPLRYEISNNGAGAAANMDCICSQVTVEGGISDNGVLFSADRGITALTTNNNTSLYPLVGIRLKSTHLHASVHPSSLIVACASQANFRWSLCINPTFAGTAPTWADKTNSALQVCVTTTNATTVSSEGTVIASGYTVQSSNYFPNAEQTFGGFLHLGSSIAGVVDQMWLCAQRITGTTEHFYGQIGWREEV